LGAALALAACEDGTLGFLEPSGGSGTAASGTATTVVERDVEAPEVFQATEAGLWDGRPSLGGVWVAHPDVTEPERVLIRNETNDNFVIGALFRRERDNPGPRLQVSSDAAAELGMLAGQPVRLNVTALKREEAEPAPAAEPEEAEPEVQVAAAEAPALDPATPEEPAPDAAVAEAAPQPAPDTEPAPKKGFFATLFGPKEDTAPAAADAPSAGAPVASVETAALDGAEPAPAPAEPPRPASPLDKPFIQIGIFSVEQNASNSAVSLRRDGILPTVRKQSSSGKTFWRVVVGPAQSSSERAALLKKVKALGYSDAYFVTN
jgi:cell division protein FtsN